MKCEICGYKLKEKKNNTYSCVLCEKEFYLVKTKKGWKIWKNNKMLIDKASIPEGDWIFNEQN